MKKHNNLFIALCISIIIFISSCSPLNSQSPERVVELYLQALVDKDGATISNLSCSDWEPDAIMELDSLQAVEVELEDLLCQNVATENDFTLVNCKGFMVATYNGENQKIDLSVRNYQVIKTGSNFLVCGYR